MIKCKTKSKLKALLKHGIDVKGDSAMYDKENYMFRVDAIVSEKDKKRLESEGYIVEIVSDLSKVAEERLKEISKTNRFSDMDMMAMTDERILSIYE